MNTLCVIQARYTSSRLPGKVLRPLLGKPLLRHVVDRCSAAVTVDDLLVAYPDNRKNRPLANWIRENNCPHHAYTGAESDVLGRFFEVAAKYKPEFIVRVCADSPLIDPESIDELVLAVQDEEADYGGFLLNGIPSVQTGTAYPEVFRAANLAALILAREHVTVPMYMGGEQVWLARHGQFKRTVVDTEDDLANAAYIMKYQTPICS